MTVLTRAFCGSGYSRLAGILTTVVFLAFQSSAQAPQVRLFGMNGHTIKETSASEPSADVVEAPVIHPTQGPTHRLLITQTETKRKPNLPVSVVKQTTEPSAEPTATEPAQDSNESATSEEPFEPAWRPFDKLPRESRFLKDDPIDTDEQENGVSEKFHWKPAIRQSLIIQGFQLGYALVIQEKTRRALKGPFFDDYWESIKGVRGWDDGNKFFTNYIAHPMQGGMTGFIFVQNHDRAKKQKFGESKQYWKDRFKAFVWSAAWSTNWEIGPISQSSVGNVGLYGHQGYVDFVITPTVGTGWMLTEEALDRYVIRHLETKGPKVKKIVRTFLNPMRSVANLLRFKEPWYRDRPFGH